MLFPLYPVPQAFSRDAAVFVKGIVARSSSTFFTRLNFFLVNLLDIEKFEGYDKEKGGEASARLNRHQRNKDYPFTA